MDLLARLSAAVEALGPKRQGGERCGADWRRPDGYWRCSRAAGHRGRHRMRPADRANAPSAADRLRSGDGRGGVAAG